MYSFSKRFYPKKSLRPLQDCTERSAVVLKGHQNPLDPRPLTNALPATARPAVQWNLEWGQSGRTSRRRQLFNPGWIVRRSGQVPALHEMIYGVCYLPWWTLSQISQTVSAGSCSVCLYSFLLKVHVTSHRPHKKLLLWLGLCRLCCFQTADTDSCSSPFKSESWLDALFQPNYRVSLCFLSVFCTPLSQ